MKKIKKQMKETFLNVKLPEFDEQIFSKKGTYAYMGTEKKEGKKKFIWLGSVCTAVFCLLILGGVYFNNHYDIQNTIGIDVNPSLELKVNKQNEVREVVANNDDAESVLQDMDLVGSDINVAVNALIGSMVQLGYLDDLSNSILISVDGENSEALRVELLDNLNIGDDYSVVSQEISDNYSDLATEYNISEGKVQLINQVIASNPIHTFDELAGLSINELNLLLGSSDNTVGSASEKAYIGRDNALAIALNHAGVSEADVAHYEIEMDYDYAIVYEIEFYYNNVEYDYEINALTGDIIKYDRDGEHHTVNNNTSNNSSTNNNDSSDNATNNSTNNNTSNNSSNNNTSNNTTNNSTTTGSYIGRERAQEIALNHAGLSSGEVRFDKVELDVDDNRTTYEIEFDYNYYEYEYDIDAYTGEILKSEVDR